MFQGARPRNQADPGARSEHHNGITVSVRMKYCEKRDENGIVDAVISAHNEWQSCEGRITSGVG